MSQLPIGSRSPRDPQRPVADAQRDDLTQRLNTAYERGDLSLEDYQGLLAQLFEAHTTGDLVPVVQALPAQYRVPSAPQGAEVDTNLAPGEVNQSRKRADLSLPMAKVGIGIAAVLAIIVVAIVIGVAL